MKISVIQDPEKLSFFKDHGLIYCMFNEELWLVESETHLSELLKRYHLYNSQEDTRYLITTDKHHNQLSKEITEQVSVDLNVSNRSRSEERILNVLEQAIILKASDVHFIRDDDTAKIKFRVNGKIDLYQEILATDCDEILFVLYNVMASTKETTWNTKTPQDANILVDINEVNYRFRYAHMPIFGRGVGGSSYHAVVRVIYPNQKSVVCTDLKSLNLRTVEQRIINTILSNPSGLVVVSGVTGSGKSTSLKNYMEFLYYTKYQQRGCFLTVEDPVEYVIEGAQQSSVVKSKSGQNLFAEAIRSSMRRDPDVLMIGEIRDSQTGQALASAVESGHLCLTTVHAGNVVGVLQRLNGLGVGLDKLSTPGFIVGVMNQKLVPQLCPKCSEPIVNEYGRNVRIQGKGCDNCKQQGIVGRKLVLEQMIPDLNVLKLVSEQRWVDIYTYNKSKRSKKHLGEGYSIKDKIYYLCLEGFVDSNFFSDSYGGLEPEDENIIFSVYQSERQASSV